MTRYLVTRTLVESVWVDVDDNATPDDAVNELLEKGISPDTVVYSEGCDCPGKAATIEMFSDGKLLVTRSAND